MPVYYNNIHTYMRCIPVTLNKQVNAKKHTESQKSEDITYYQSAALLLALNRDVFKKAGLLNDKNSAASCHLLCH